MRLVWRLRNLVPVAGTVIPLRVMALALLVATATAHAQEWLYTVRPGDNLWNITADYLTSMHYWSRLQALNSVADPEHLPPGMKLRIPVLWLKRQPTTAQVLTVQGKADVTVAATEETVSARSGLALQSGDEIRTGPDGNVTLEFGDGSRLLLQADSLLVMDTLSAYGTTNMVDTRLRLQQGRADSHVTPRQNPLVRYEIQTPAASSAVRGTRYRLGMDAVNAVARAEVLEGTVAVAGARKTRTVATGFGAVAEAGQPPAPPVRLLTAPAVTELPPVVTRVPIQLGFPALPGAVAYRTQIAPDEKFETVLFDGVSQPPQVRGPDLPDGDYVLRLRGIDARGLEGHDAYHRFRLHARPEPPFLVRPGHQTTVPEKAPTFEWTEAQNAVAYHVQLAEDERFTKLLLDLPDYSNSRLTPEQPLEPRWYYWRVATRNRAGAEGPFSDPQRFRLQPTPKVKPPEAVEGTLIFRWSAGLPGQQYQVQLAKDSNFENIIVDRQVAEPEMAIAWPASGFHYLRMRTVDADGYVAPYGPVQRIDIPPQSYWPYVIVLGLILGL